MNPIFLILNVLQSLFFIVLGLMAGYYFGKLKNTTTESGQFRKSIELWHSLVNRIDKFTHRNSTQLVSLRERILELKRSLSENHVEGSIDKLAEEICYLESEVRSLRAFPEAIHNGLLENKSGGLAGQNLTRDSLNTGHTRCTGHFYDFGDFVDELQKKVELDTPVKRLLDFVYEHLRAYVPYQRMGYAEIDYDADRVTAVWYRSERPGLLIGGYSAPLSESSLRFVAQQERPRILNNLSEYLQRHPESDSTRLIVQEGYRSSLTMPVSARGSVVAFLFISNIEVNSFDDEAVILVKEVVAVLGRSVHLPQATLVTDL